MNENEMVGQRLKVSADAQVIPGPERIVRALAAEQYPGCLGSCRFCDQSYDPLDLDGAEWHLPDCAWRLAREWVAANPEAG